MKKQPNMPRITASYYQDQYDVIMTVAEKRRVSPGVVLREMVQYWIDENKE